MPQLSSCGVGIAAPQAKPGASGCVGVPMAGESRSLCPDAPAFRLGYSLTMLKTRSCGELRPSHEGESVTLAGWVPRRRDHGGLIFIDLRDRFGLTQVAADPKNAEAHAAMSELRGEYVAQITGKVRGRPAGNENPNMPTGAVEVEALEVKLLNAAKPTPFYINEESAVD